MKYLRCDKLRLDKALKLINKHDYSKIAVNIEMSIIDDYFTDKSNSYFSDIENNQVLKDLNEISPKNELERLKDDSCQKLFILRHGERVDHIFGNWTSQCFDNEGRYIRNDLNMPLELPSRAFPVEAYKRDAPLTRLGILQSTLVGETFNLENIKIHHIYCSPALRCIQTANYFLNGLKMKHDLKIKIEPGLYDWVGISNKPPLPTFLTIEELTEAGFNIDTSYKPFVSLKELSSVEKETFEQLRKRYSYISKCALKAHATGNVLFVGHSPTTSGCTYDVIGCPISSDPDVIYKHMFCFPYCGIVALHKYADKWMLIKEPRFSFTCSKNLRVNYNQFQ